jgi:hypothetical protein
MNTFFEVLVVLAAICTLLLVIGLAVAVPILIPHIQGLVTRIEDAT